MSGERITEKSASSWAGACIRRPAFSIDATRALARASERGLLSVCAMLISRAATTSSAPDRSTHDSRSTRLCCSGRSAQARDAALGMETVALGHVFLAGGEHAAMLA